MRKYLKRVRICVSCENLYFSEKNRASVEIFLEVAPRSVFFPGCRMFEKRWLVLLLASSLGMVNKHPLFQLDFV